MEKEFPFALVTPAGTVFQGDVRRVTLVGENGSFSILAGHAPLVSSLPKQTAEWEDASGVHAFFLSGGLAETSSQGLTVLSADSALI